MGFVPAAFLLVAGPIGAAIVSSSLLRQFAEKDVTWLSFLTSVAGFTLAFSTILVIPFDVWESLAYAPKDDDASQDSAEEFHGEPIMLSAGWKTIYWISMVLCYVFFPVLMEYEASAEFTAAARLQDAIRRNITFYAVSIVIGIVVICWLLIRGEIEGNLEDWLIAASNAWGLLLLTVLMGFGLVAVPRHLWRLSNPRETLKGLYSKAVEFDESRLSRQFELQDAITQIRGEVTDVVANEPAAEHALRILKETLATAEGTHADLLARKPGLQGTNTSPPRMPLRSPHGGTADAAAGAPLRQVNIANLGKLHLLLKKSALEARQAAHCWDSHVLHCILFEDLEDKEFQSAAQLVSGCRETGGWLARLCLRCPQVSAFGRHVLAWWFRALRTRTLTALGWACSFLSGIVVLAQMTLLSEGWSLSLLSLFFKADHGPVLTQAFCIVPLSYMTCTAYFSVFHLKISGWYGLYAGHGTDAGSLLWCASLLTRLAAPLCYHFLKIIAIEGTSFQSFMGQMNVTALGERFNNAFPLIVAVLCCLNVLNIYSKILQCISMGGLEFECTLNDIDDPTSEGMQLVARERRRLVEEAASAVEMQARDISCQQPVVPVRQREARTVPLRGDGTD
eukprot:TRINITY_DN27657_c0_g1_i3.p1 TRINITY_DN27657_c0_g1~~TRINITY_DN27657_c0_g1_i3.p1  ORF type:complete len:622 (-),score=79.39 TRINITY_DN27657_c0_g1_i3:96-1961(-)